MKNQAAVALAKMRLGCKEQPSEKKRVASLNNLRKAWAKSRADRKLTRKAA